MYGLGAREDHSSDLLPQGVVTLVAAVLPVVAFVQIFDDCGAVISGILRARGKQVRVKP